MSSEAKLTSILNQAQSQSHGNTSSTDRPVYKLKAFTGTLPPKNVSSSHKEEQEEEETGSRRPKQVSREQWDAMEEEEKMQAVKRFNPALYQKLLAEEEEPEDVDEEEYVSRRPPEVDKDEWDNMTEDEKQHVIDYYSKPAQQQQPSITIPTNTVHKLGAREAPRNQARDAREGREYREIEKEGKKEEHEDDADDDDDQQPASKYKLSNLIDFFNKFDIRLLSVFNVKKRIKLLLISVESFNVCVYMPTRYEMYMERPIGIATYELQEDDEEEEQDTLFYNRLPIESMKREKSSKVKSLMRFLPLVTESPIKTMYIGKYFLSYITKNNDIDSYLCSSPVTDTGYYYIIDLQFLFSHIKNISGELLRFESAFNNAVYDRLTTEVEKTKTNLNKAIKKVQNIQPQGEKKTFNQKLAKLYAYLKQEKHKEKASAFLIDVRQKNLNNMFDIENVTYVMKEFK